MPNTVRVIYIVPTDAQEWPAAKRRASEVLEDLQHFFADQMNQHSYGPKTFEIAKSGDGDLLFEVRPSSLAKAEFQADPIKACQQELGGGRPLGAPDIEICFFEAYSIINGVAFVPGAKTKRRRCYINSLHLKTANRDWLHDVGGYCGRLFPWISPEPMLGTTLKWERGQGLELGDVAGAAFGVIAHELAHSFGADDHEGSDDIAQRKGNLMGTGFRGMRGFFRPDKTDDYCVLGEVDAKAFDQSKFFSVRKLKRKGRHFFRPVP